MKSLVRKNAEICLCCQFNNILSYKKGGKERKSIKETIEVLLGCKFSQKSNLLLFCRFRFFEIFHCADGHALSFGKGGEVKGEGSGVFSSRGWGSMSWQCAHLAWGWGRPPAGRTLWRNALPEEKLSKHWASSSWLECQVKRIMLCTPPFLWQVWCYLLLLCFPTQLISGVSLLRF